MKTLTLLFTIFCGMANAATYYISPTGSGTDGKSFATHGNRNARADADNHPATVWGI